MARPPSLVISEATLAAGSAVDICNGDLTAASREAEGGGTADSRRAAGYQCHLAVKPHSIRSSSDKAPQILLSERGFELTCSPVIARCGRFGAVASTRWQRHLHRSQECDARPGPPALRIGGRHDRVVVAEAPAPPSRSSHGRASGPGRQAHRFGAIVGNQYGAEAIPQPEILD